MVSEVASRALAELLEAETGQELSPNRLWRIGTVLSGLFREYDVANVDQLILKLARSRHTCLARKVVEALLNNETYFFRDRAMFDLLAHRVLPELARRRASERRLSIWSVGCSTGQEALSLAMLFARDEARWAGWTIDILGTDVSRSVIETARVGRYSQFEVQRGLAMGEMIKWFEETPQGWQVQNRLLKMVRYQSHNLLEPLPNAPRFDLVLCRNVLLYFDVSTRTRAFERVANVLAPDGWLMLGAGETTIGQTDRIVSDREFPGLYRFAEPGMSPRSSRARRTNEGPSASTRRSTGDALGAVRRHRQK